MSAAAYLACWVTLGHPSSTGPEGGARHRPAVPRQQTWAEGRWHAFFHHPESLAAEPAIGLPRQRAPRHDIVDSDSPALA